MNRWIASLAVAALGSAAALAQTRSPAPPDAEVYIIAPSDGQTFHGSVTVQFGLKGMGVAPAGVKFDNTGHHHLLVDTDLSQINLDAPLPTTDKIVHFGKGQTEVRLTLPPGKHTLELLFADYLHIPFNPTLHSKKITITVD